MAFEKLLSELQQKKAKALEQGGQKKVQRQHKEGRMTARERISSLLDKNSFFELGQLNTSDMPGMEDKTPTDGVVAGYGTINLRQIAIVANDFTTLASTMARVNARKTAQLRTQATANGFPFIWLGEAGGARMPDIQGTNGLFSFSVGERSAFPGYVHERKTPMVAAVYGECYGVPTWQASIADFVVQVKGSALSVSGPRALGKAIGQTYTGEEMGGWQIHAEKTGVTDQVAENEEESFAKIKEFLSYMPSHNGELPPAKPWTENTYSKINQILKYIPVERTETYDMHNVVACIVDNEEYLELKPYFGRSVITCLGRVYGEPLGFIANNPAYMAGAMDTDGLDKFTSFMCLCDCYNIPIVFIQDIPGFLVGKAAEEKRVAVKVVNNIKALSQVTVPKITIIARKIYGQTAINMCGPGAGPDYIVAWPTAEIGFMAPEIAANVVFGHLPEDQRNTLVSQMIQDASPYPAAQKHYIYDIIDPRETRDYLKKILSLVKASKTKGIGQHLLSNWPTKF